MKTFKQWQDQFEEMASTNTASVVGAGDDSSTVVVRKKYDRKKKRKDVPPILQRMIDRRENPLI